MTEADRDLEKMCRDHFNEPILAAESLGRLIGYAEDDCDGYLIVQHMGGQEIWHTCVGGYYFLDRLKGQRYVRSVKGEDWDDFVRLDYVLSLNGAPRAAEFKLDVSARATSADSGSTG